MKTLAIVSDCRGSADIDRNLVAELSRATKSLTTAHLPGQKRVVVSEAKNHSYSSAVVVTGESKGSQMVIDRLKEYVSTVKRVSPFLGKGLNRENRSRLVGATARAALVSPTRRTIPELRGAGGVVVVGDLQGAREASSVAEVTLVADGRDFSSAFLGGVELVRGSAKTVEREKGRLALKVETRVLDDCTGCGACFGENGVTARPVDVLSDEDMECPIGAIADSPVVEEVVGDQVIWPEYDGALCDPRVHRKASALDLRIASAKSDAAPVEASWERCVSGRRGQLGCDRCVETCPFDAVSLDMDGEGSLEVLGEVCTGCGACLSACPTEALETPDSRPLQKLVNATESAMEVLRGDRGHLGRKRGRTNFGIAFVSKEGWSAFRSAAEHRAAPTAVPIEVSSPERVPPSLLAYAVVSAADWALVVGDTRTGAVDDADSLLTEAGLEDRIAWAEPEKGAIIGAVHALDRSRSLDFNPEPSIDNHGLTVEILRSLGGKLNGKEVEAPFLGSVTVDTDGCSVCPTCSSLCPVDAFGLREEGLYLDVEGCVGCGLCEAACPEGAISLSGSVSPDEWTGPELIVEREGLICERCGSDFGAKGIAASVAASLEGTSAEALKLELCPRCRRKRFSEPTS